MPAFVSYSSKDEAIYTSVCDSLDHAGVARWNPKTMSFGDHLAGQLRDAISACEVCVFLATPHSVKSPWCLAELGAFWGAGKRVILYMTDSSLKDAALPPQFKGTLRAYNSSDLTKALKEASDAKNAEQAAQYDFFPSSGDYGSDKEWGTLLDDTRLQFDVLGVALYAWRKANKFKERAIAKAEGGCRIRFLLMHQENDMLKGLLRNDVSRDLHSLTHDIVENYAYYSDLAAKNENIFVRQIKSGMPHFHLTLSDRGAVITQFLSSSIWATGPTWRCAAGSPLFDIVTEEFEYLWARNETPAILDSWGSL